MTRGAQKHHGMCDAEATDCFPIRHPGEGRDPGRLWNENSEMSRGGAEARRNINMTSDGTEVG
jgi:hypothetical protein